MCDICEIEHDRDMKEHYAQCEKEGCELCAAIKREGRV